jgi:hypothetical protein
MVRSDFYCNVLRCLRENVQRKRLELWRNHNWLLHHDNVSTHTSLKNTEFVTDNHTVIIPHPPHLPDLAPCDFTLFPKLKMKLKGWRFETVSNIQRELQKVLSSIKENDFCDAFEVWKKTMGSLYTFPRRLFWRRLQPKMSKLSQHFFFDLIRELSDTPLYVSYRPIARERPWNKQLYKSQC